MSLFVVKSRESFTIYVLDGLSMLVDTKQGVTHVNGYSLIEDYKTMERVEIYMWELQLRLSAVDMNVPCVLLIFCFFFIVFI